MYYFTVNINDRRIHICELRSKSETIAGEKPADPIFGFLFTGNTLFHTNPRGDNELIARNGKNIELKDNYHFVVKKESSVCNLPTYGFWFEKGDDNNNDNVIPDDMPFAIDPDADNFQNTGIKINFKCKGSRKTIEDKFVIQLHITVDDEDFCYSFKGYNAVAGIGGNITDAAIDFGSEASQISIGGARINIVELIRENFYPQFHRVNNKTVENEVLWQYDPNKTFYKSAYFVHKEPNETNYADKPNNHGEKSFVQTLLPISIEESYYNDLILLPNLKLMDVLGTNDNAGAAGNMSTNIKIKAGNIKYRVDNPKLPVNATNMTDPDFRQNTLRVILCNLMHCILANTTPIVNNKTNRYLRMVMLMPNVYDQKKVYDIVEGLYIDFDETIKSTNEHLYDGLEVAVISESDAAFLGAITKYNKLFQDLGPRAPKKYYLIVDAGKGTTDFSIMHTSDNNLCVWNSLYRGGLPASGHSLTYAIYEALWAYFYRTRNINLDKVIRDNHDMYATWEFMGCLEEIKKNYSTFKEIEDGQIQINDTNDTLREVTISIKRIIRNGFLVEGTRKIMNDKVTEMANLVVKGISGYMKGAHKNEKFGMVLFTGRAFMLKPFKEAIKKALIESNLIDNNTPIPQFNGDALKTICLDGSTNIGGRYWINNNSELICKPSVKQSGFNIGDLFSLWANKFSSDDAFYYDGIYINNSKNARLQMGLGASQLNNVQHVYYVGRGLLLKTPQNDGTIDQLVFQQTIDVDDATKISKMTMESLFPYHSGSIPADNRHTPLYEPGKNDQTNNKSSSKNVEPESKIVITVTDNNASPTESTQRNLQGNNTGSDLGDF